MVLTSATMMKISVGIRDLLITDHNYEYSMSDSLKELEKIIRKINRAWLDEDYSYLEEVFHDDIVFTDPAGEKTLEGKDNCIESYIRFMSSAKVFKFEEKEFNSYSWDSAAVIEYSFCIDYEIDGEHSRENGKDVYAFQRREGGWKAVWRVMML